jgi:4-aminobutyrate aminotransferase
MIDYVLGREGDVAAFIAEPIRAVPYLPPRGFWNEVRKICDRHGTLLVFDEIPTGLGKTGKMFACEHDSVTPDILVLGKSLGGGILPIAAVIAKPELDVGEDYAFGHYTHEKNPVTARAALTTIEIIEDEGLVANAAKVGAAALARLNDIKAKRQIVGDVRGQGLLIGIELVTDRAAKTPAGEAAEKVMYRALELGLSFKTTFGNVLTLTPPLTVSEAQMNQAIDIIDRCLAEILISVCEDDTVRLRAQPRVARFDQHRSAVEDLNAALQRLALQARHRFPGVKRQMRRQDHVIHFE